MELNKSQIWEKEQLEKRLRELKKAGIELTLSNIPIIIKKMSYRVRSQEQPDDCICYQQNTPCHPQVKDLNCLVCACPNYESEKLEGGCKINSKKGKITFHENLPLGRIWDCSDCPAYHTPKAVEIYLRKNMEKLRELSEKLS